MASHEWNSKDDDKLNEVVGTVSLAGWTRKDFIDELNGLRNVVTSNASTAGERMEAIGNAMTLQLRCNSKAFSEGTILPMIEEMKQRQRMLTEQAITRLFR